jgi:hypothetical protein
LTYSFNPTFFEKLVLSDLWYGGTGEIVVVADQRELEEGLQFSAGQLRYLGSGYHLAAGNRTAFHPKIILRIGASGAYLWLGSGNITHGGWGGNHELAVAWKLDGGDPLSQGITSGLLNRMITYCGSESSAEAIRRVADRTWISSATATELDSPIIFTAPERPLADDLSSRWDGRRFTALRIFTGSTDREGRFIRWCHDTFGIERCVVVVDPRTASFDPASLDRLPIPVTIEPALNAPYLHAKLYWFEGPDGNAAVVGSANCSAAAWLIAPNYGGNVEAVCVYDDADRQQFSSLLDCYSGTGLKPSEVSGLGKQRENDEEPTPGPVYRLTELILLASQQRLVARLATPAPAGAHLSLRFPEQTIEIGESDGQQSEWDLPCPELTDRGITLFGELLVAIDGEVFTSPPRWVDDQDRLRQAARRGGFGRISGGFKSGATSSERNAFLEELQLITKSLFSEPGAFPDPAPERKKQETDVEMRAVKPDDVIRHLADIEEKPHTLAQHDVPTAFTLHGIMRELFGGDDEVEAEPNEELWDDDDDSDKKGLTKSSTENADTDVNSSNTSSPPTERQRKQLKKTMESYLEQLGKPRFSEQCSAWQLVQAISLPLLMASAGQNRGWFDRSDARHWILFATDRLFRVKDASSSSNGLIELVRHRYETNGQSETFSQVVGDGTLWLALISAISGLEWETTTSVIERALTLQEVLRCQDLLATVEVGKLGILATRLKSASEGKTLLARAAIVNQIMVRLESFLTQHFGFLTEKQVGEDHTIGDVVWRKNGWGTIRESCPISPTRNVLVYWRSRGEETKMKAAGFFVNVTKAGRKYRDLKQMVEELQGVFSTNE